jgi:hypothetical protein
MDEFVDELVACRNELPAPDAARTMIMSEPVVAAPPRQTPRKPRNLRRLLLPLLLLLLLAGLAAGGYELWHRHGSGASSSGGGNPPPPAAPVDLHAVGAHDPPPGDGVERNDLLGKATDGSTSSFWQTEHYTTASFGNLKHGVGLVVDAGSDVKLRTLTVDTATPGFTAEIQAGSSQRGPFETVSSSQTVEGRTTFSLDLPSARRYYVVWITQLAHFDTGDPTKQYGAQVAEVTAGR